MTKTQSKRFDNLCRQMAEFMEEVRKDIPNATLFIEDGTAAIYDWPIYEQRPTHPISNAHIWTFASGGGK